MSSCILRETQSLHKRSLLAPKIQYLRFNSIFDDHQSDQTQTHPSEKKHCGATTVLLLKDPESAYHCGFVGYPRTTGTGQHAGHSPLLPTDKSSVLSADKTSVLLIAEAS